LNYTLKRTALHSFLNPVSFDPPLVGLLMDGQAVAHQAGSQICRDAPAQQA
jgi:flavin reductase (DIM6/NTAB) family NADH-FMN oxidoreductase RutF